MSIYAGLDVSDKTTHVCVVDVEGRVLRRDVVASDPGVLAKWLNAWLGEPLSDVAERNMRAWWKTNAEGRQSPVGSAPAEPGLSHDEIAERFAFYTDRFVRTG